MEAALVSVATGVLKPVLGKLIVLLGNEYKRFKGVRKVIRSLTHELGAMEAFLLKMSEVEDPDPRDKVWMNEVRELSYDLEDAIDDFMQSIGDNDEKPNGFIEKIKSSLGKLGKMKARRRIGKEIQDLKKQIIEVGDRNARYKSRETFSKTVNATVDPRALAIFEHASKLVGIEKPKAEIIKLLMEDDIRPPVQQQQQQQKQQHPKIVSIVGSGGMGKTTLANQVYQELKGQYECRAFVSVSRNPDMMNILRTIFSEVAKTDYASTEAGNIQQLIIKITDFLADKRYFVVVDDIWDVYTWDVIKHAFPLTSSGSIIITTTRINDVHIIRIRGKVFQYGWIAEGFIHGEARYTLYELGERCFNELLNRGLIQPGKIDRYGKVKNCQVHDTILDFIISKSIDVNFVTLPGVPILTIGTQSKVVRRLSLQGFSKEKSTILPAGLVLSHVRSLNMFGIFWEIPSLEEFSHLRVLDLSQQSLEEHHLENIVRLFQLRYLNIKGTRIGKLPEQIGRLGCLEMLDLTGTFIEKLPASIVNLRKLSHLLVEGEVKLPDGIAKMQALETLKDVDASIQSIDFLCGLGQLMNLRSLRLILDFEFDSDTEDTNMVGEEHNKAVVSSLCKLGTQNLRSLTIEFGSSLLHEESLCLPTLEDLSIRFWDFPQVPTWVSSLRNLQQLHIEVEVVKQDDLCILGALPSLLVLHLNEETESNEKLRISAEIGFRFLNIFIYDARYEPVDLMFGTGSMPKLEKLELNQFCMVEANSLGFGIENLPCLTSVKCIDVEGDDGIVEAVKTAMEGAASTHPNHPSLLFERYH